MTWEPGLCAGDGRDESVSETLFVTDRPRDERPRVGEWRWHAGNSDFRTSVRA